MIKFVTELTRKLKSGMTGAAEGVEAAVAAGAPVPGAAFAAAFPGTPPAAPCPDA